jgi:hypothetical protein
MKETREKKDNFMNSLYICVRENKYFILNILSKAFLWTIEKFLYLQCCNKFGPLDHTTTLIRNITYDKSQQN